jgi:hypothetical protein
MPFILLGYISAQYKVRLLEGRSYWRTYVKRAIYRQEARDGCEDRGFGMLTWLKFTPDNRKFARGIVDHYTRSLFSPKKQCCERRKVLRMLLNVIPQRLGAKVSPCAKTGITFVPSTHNSVQDEDGS